MDKFLIIVYAESNKRRRIQHAVPPIVVFNAIKEVLNLSKAASLGKLQQQIIDYGLKL